MSGQHTPGLWEVCSGASYSGDPAHSDPAMMNWAVSVECDAPFVENEHGGYERCETQTVVRAFGRTIAEAQANAARIVLTWNCHDDLVAALTAIDGFWTEAHPAGPDGDPAHGLGVLSDDTITIWRGIRAALSRATSPTP
jgi:hypothetical protein